MIKEDSWPMYHTLWKGHEAKKIGCTKTGNISNCILFLHIIWLFSHTTNIIFSYNVIIYLAILLVKPNEVLNQMTNRRNIGNMKTIANMCLNIHTKQFLTHLKPILMFRQLQRPFKNSILLGSLLQWAAAFQLDMMLDVLIKIFRTTIDKGKALY